MLMLKTITIIAAGLLSLIAMRKIMAAAEAAKVRVRAKQPEAQTNLQRLRQDPRTGVYYPDN